MEIRDIPNFSKYLATSTGDILSKYSGQKLKQRLRKDGYLQVQVIDDGSQKSRLQLSHRLVAFSFLKSDPNRKEINHKNGCKADNRVENLEWCSRSENIRHSIDVLGNDHAKSGFDCNAAKISASQSDQIGRWYKNNVLEPSQLAQWFGVNKATIQVHINKQNCRNRKPLINAGRM